MATLWFEQIRDSDKGTYTCEFGSDTATIKIDVIEPIDFRNTPKTQHLIKGEDGFIVCDVTSYPLPLLTWKFNNFRINEDQHYDMEERGLRVNGVTMSDRGTYTCVARIKETGDVDQKDIEVEVHATPSRTTWVRPPRDIKGHEGQKIILECQLSNTKGLKHRWLRDSTYLTHDGRSIFDEYTVLDDGYGRSTLVIKNASHTDSAVFACEHINANPQRMSARVDVLTPFASVELTQYAHNKYSCNATHGNPGAIKIHWKINDEVVASVKPWSVEEEEGFISSGSVYEVDSGVLRRDGNVKLTCEVVQSVGEEGQSQSIDVPASDHGVPASDHGGYK
ncbi:neural cell adhesion molecule 1-like [Ptychodera flava]|uniref:neural cell adhesion molecule 1-like n=1 Tax=Ptychodera flava TaxID=63121 RepID=UPI00396A1228